MERISVRLRLESWENIFRVLKWCAPLECSNEEGYQAQEGGHFTLGGFWAQVQEAQRQVGEATEAAREGRQKGMERDEDERR